mmetsp:Transcript_18950/g.65754  ORF Transcript_18950/g.65754 Transcript_18950/m.65754 type:complete len:294 (-) Transcript_18950:61-942(-)
MHLRDDVRRQHDARGAHERRVSGNEREEQHQGQQHSPEPQRQRHQSLEYVVGDARLDEAQRRHLQPWKRCPRDVRAGDDATETRREEEGDLGGARVVRTREAALVGEREEPQGQGRGGRRDERADGGPRAVRSRGRVLAQPVTPREEESLKEPHRAEREANVPAEESRGAVEEDARDDAEHQRVAPQRAEPRNGRARARDVEHFPGRKLVLASARRRVDAREEPQGEVFVRPGGEELQLPLDARLVDHPPLFIEQGAGGLGLRLVDIPATGEASPDGVRHPLHARVVHSAHSP